ncbi:hypothetical protein RHMOL_Rhmol11G0226800 [Rhododendron molle]|uniref:Uncharacterized protein n=1 Tax=Rhododendron molle TaxID=49168 RepID=A0ACC0LW67_RHOML|nr:hypothetical protein RHMOL_Rhmol11G0226800 [Rhododendron molle]
MATERKADHYSSLLSLKNLLRSRFNTNSPLLSTLNVLQLLLVLVLCTSTFAAFSQSIVKALPGPIHFEKDYFDGKFPNLAYNPFSWTKAASMIYLDGPVGSGFSYADNAESYIGDDLLYATDVYNFLLKWLMDHPTFLSNELYIGGDSYSGLIVPIVVQKIYNGNSEAGVQRQLKLQGYILGNPVTSQHDDKNARIEYAHRHALLSDKLYESIKHNCHGEYIIIDPNNAPCIRDLTLVEQCLTNIFYPLILEPSCNYDSNNSSKLKWDRGFIDEERPRDFLLLPAKPQFWCRFYNYYVLSDIWANDERVREALHVRKGTKDKWLRCNESMAYTEVVFSSLDYHKNLSHTPLRALIYSGDHDMLVPYSGTHKWIESLGLTVDEEWRPWFVDGQNAGYSMRYVMEDVGFRLREQVTQLQSTSLKKVFTCSKGGLLITIFDEHEIDQQPNLFNNFFGGAGHTAPEYKPKEALTMIERWLAFYYL